MPEDQKIDKPTEPVTQSGPSISSAPFSTMAGRKWHWRSPKVMSLILLVIIIVIGLSAWLVLPNKNSSTSTGSKAPNGNYTYTGLIETDLKSYPTAGGGMSVKKPDEMKAAKTPSDYTGTFADYIAGDYAHDNSGAFVSSLSMLIDRSKKSPSADYLASLQKAFAASSSDQAYVNAVKSVSGFVTTGVPASWKFTLGQASAFTNPNIKANAWEFDYSLVKQAAVSAGQDPDSNLLQGKVVYAIGANAEYYLAFNAVGSNLQNNQAVWQQVLDSLKIDQ